MTKATDRKSCPETRLREGVCTSRTPKARKGALLDGRGQDRADKVFLHSEALSNLLPILSVHGEGPCLTSAILGLEKLSWESGLVVLGEMDPSEN